MTRRFTTTTLTAVLILFFAASMDVSAQDAPIRPAVTGVKTYTVNLAGTEGAADATGRAFVVVNPNSGRVCWGHRVDGIRTPTMAHIHEGAAGATGSPVVTLDLRGTCTTGVDRELGRRITSNPEGFYVNIHNEDFPGGALRGQLRD